MKSARHQAILDLIEKYPIDRQEDLLEHLRRAGFDVTQATVSRDIRELRLVKTATGEGGYRYMPANGNGKVAHSPNRFETIFRESVLKVDYAGHMVLVKCFSGMANAACEVFDAQTWEGVVGTLSGDDSGEMMGAADLLGSVVNELAESARLDESLAPLSERLSDLYYGARELATDLADRLDGYDFDPGELDQIEERLDQIYRMKQRYGASVEELLTRRDKAAEELEGYQSSGKRIAELTQRKQELYRQTKAAAETLTQARLKAFTSMNRQMREALEFLNMPGVRMVLRHQRGPLASAGQDNIEFLISTNPGEEPKPLAKIASGGELSRIMLAFKSALADKDAISTVIYDEIDTGVSGLAAGRIGQKLKQTASGHQVLCITHTPQIAAFADNQLLIEKKVRDNRTFTEIHPLDLDGRVQVLALMISGDKVTDLSLANARELIEKSQG